MWWFSCVVLSLFCDNSCLCWGNLWQEQKLWVLFAFGRVLLWQEMWVWFALGGCFWWVFASFVVEKNEVYEVGFEAWCVSCWRQHSQVLIGFTFLTLVCSLWCMWCFLCFLFTVFLHCSVFTPKWSQTLETLLSLSSILFLCFFLFSNGVIEAAYAHLS